MHVVLIWYLCTEDRIMAHNRSYFTSKNKIRVKKSIICISYDIIFMIITVISDKNYIFDIKLLYILDSSDNILFLTLLCNYYL